MVWAGDVNMIAFSTQMVLEAKEWTKSAME
jgi:hypothetical protein